MATYWLSFQIDSRTIGGRDYDARWDALDSAIDRISTITWKETTSFILFETTNTIDIISTRIKAAISPNYDTVLLRMIDSKSARAIGKFDEFDTLKTMMPYITRF